MRNVVYRTLLQTSTYINEIGNRQAEKKKPLSTVQYTVLRAESNENYLEQLLISIQLTASASGQEALGP